MSIGKHQLTPLRLSGLGAGLLAFVLLSFVDAVHSSAGMSPEAGRALGVTVLMACWWIFESLPIHWTAMVPLFAFPFVPVSPGDFAQRSAQAALPYIDGYIFLFAGGMCIAAAMQQWDLHRRIALSIMRVIGTEPRRLLLGFLASTAFISLWISNTATAAMMLPIALAVVKQFEKREGRRLSTYAAAIMLAIAYGANLGGIGTKIGTAPNATFAGFMSKRGVDVSFLDFLLVGLPFVIFMVPIAWWMLWRFGRSDAPSASGETTVQEELERLGVVKSGEKVVLTVFFATATLWVAAKPLFTTLEPLVRPLFQLTPAYLEGGVAMLAATVLLLARHRGTPILRLNSLKNVPWSTLLLLGGAFSMAQGVQASGLSLWMSHQLALLRELGPISQVLAASLTTVFISAVASNTATINVMLNVLHDAVTPAIRHSALFAATIASSCDFALPAGTPPNAIVFGSGYLTVPMMVRVGLLLDIVAGLVAGFWCWLIVPLVLGS